MIMKENDVIVEKRNNIRTLHYVTQGSGKKDMKCGLELLI